MEALWCFPKPCGYGRTEALTELPGCRILGSDEGSYGKGSEDVGSCRRGRGYSRLAEAEVTDLPTFNQPCYYHLHHRSELYSTFTS